MTTTTTMTPQERARTLLLKTRVAKPFVFVGFLDTFLKSFRNREFLKDFSIRARRRARLHFVLFVAKDSCDGTRARAFD